MAPLKTLQLLSVPKVLFADHKNKCLTFAERKALFSLLISGAGCRFRTGHLMITNQLLYQMS
jgi:hypothetical protein